MDWIVAAGPVPTDILPLAPLQDGMLFHAMLDAPRTVADDPYIVQTVLALDGALDADVLRRSVQMVLGRHDNLRAAFLQPPDGPPVQVIPAEVDLPWRQCDATDAAHLARLAEQERNAGFDPANPPLIRFLLVTVAAGEHRLIMTNHHILLDGWSLPLLLDEVCTAYRALVDGTALPPVTPYREYASWLAGQDRAGAENVWRTALSDVDSCLVAGGHRDTGPRGELCRDLPKGATTLLRDTARALGVTTSTIVHAAWGLVLGRLTGRRDVVFGSVVSGRPPAVAGIESMIGCFINTVPVRLRPDPAESVADLLRRVQTEQSALGDVHYLGLAALHRVAAVAELFDSTVAFENYPVNGDGIRAALPGVAIRLHQARDGMHYPLGLVAAATPDRIRLRLTYRIDLIGRRRAEQVIEWTRAVLEAMTADPDQSEGRLDILGPGEAGRSVLHGADMTDEPIRDDLVDLFAGQVAQAPDAPALVADGRTVSYRELDAWSDQLAQTLVSAGAGAETTVAVLADRTPAMIAALLGVLKAGAAYVPLDRRFPAARMRAIVAECEAKLVLIDSESAAATVPDTGVPVLDISAAPTPAGKQIKRVPPGSLAYVMYTSGSSGRPKGVAVTRQEIAWLAGDEAFSGKDRVLVHSPLAFDASTVEIWGTLINGGCLVLAPPGDLDTATIARVIRDEGVTWAWITAGLFRVLAEDEAPSFADMREVWTGGDVVPSTTVRDLLRRHPGLSLVNGYGPTETTVFATSHRVREPDAAATVPIGLPLHNTRVSVLDHALRPVPEGAVGEIYIAGGGVSRGYVGQPVPTAARYVADPSGPPGTRMYRTGDMARLNPDGVLEYVGRVDAQVKIRGFRVEPGEAEAVLATHPGVAHCVVVVSGTGSGDRRLEAHVVPAAGHRVNAGDLTRFAAGLLPSYLVPAGLVVHGSLPVTANGKVDRAALAAATPPGRRPRVAPVDHLEDVLCRLYAEVLGVPEVGTDEDFFDLGGDSLLAMRLIGRVRGELGGRAGIRDLFLAPTVARFAARHVLGGWAAPATAFDVLLPLRDEGTAAPVFCFHPASGLSWRYSGLLRELPAQVPIHGLQAGGYTDDGPLPGSVTEMATDYVARIRRVARGPYRLVGWSFGGLVAHTAATLLRDAGEKVTLLALLDAAPAEGAEAKLPDGAAIMGTLLEIAGIVPDVPMETLTVEQAAALLQQHENPMITLLGGRARRLVEIARHFTELSSRHTPRRFDGDLLLLPAARGREAGPLSADRWGPYATGEVSARLIDCEHHQMLDAAPLSEIGRVLRAALDAPDVAP
jgi:amino acid adenylation domain-containing protein